MNIFKWIDRRIPIGVVVLIILFFGFVFIQNIKPADYCEKQAKAIVGDQWDKTFPAVGYEKDYVDQITWGFREQLKCERQSFIWKN